MRISKIILNSLWVLFSFIPFINGFGFIYMGLKIKNNAWIMKLEKDKVLIENEKIRLERETKSLRSEVERFRSPQCL